MFREMSENKKSSSQHLKPTENPDQTQPTSPSQFKEIVEKFEIITEKNKIFEPKPKKQEANDSLQTKVKQIQVPATSIQISKRGKLSSSDNKANPSHSSTKPSPGYTHKQPQIKSRLKVIKPPDSYRFKPISTYLKAVPQTVPPSSKNERVVQTETNSESTKMPNFNPNPTLPTTKTKDL